MCFCLSFPVCILCSDCLLPHVSSHLFDCLPRPDEFHLCLVTCIVFSIYSPCVALSVQFVFVPLCEAFQPNISSCLPGIFTFCLSFFFCLYFSPSGCVCRTDWSFMYRSLFWQVNCWSEFLCLRIWVLSLLFSSAGLIYPIPKTSL